MRNREWIYATGPQITYIRRLLNEAFANRYTVGYTIRDWDRILRSEASRMITELKAAKERGWKEK